MTRNKLAPSAAEATGDICDGATILCGGFGGSGYPVDLIRAVAERRVKDLTLISNNAGHDLLFAYGGVRKIICSYPLGPSSRTFLRQVDRDPVELLLEPQGTLVERIRSAGAGLGGFLTRVGLGADFVGETPTVELDGQQYLLVRPLRGDFALLRAWKADMAGNLIYRHAARNFNIVMATAAPVVIAEVSELVTDGYLDPDQVHTPGPFVDRVVLRRSE